MDDPTSVVMAHAPSTTRQRLSHRDAPGLKVSRITVDVPTRSSSTDTTVIDLRAVPADDPERPPPRLGPEALEDLEELLRGIDELARAMLTKFPPTEVFTQVTHSDSGLPVPTFGWVLPTAPLDVPGIIHPPGDDRLQC